jgi:hypothetical protein
MRRDGCVSAVSGLEPLVQVHCSVRASFLIVSRYPRAHSARGRVRTWSRLTMQLGLGSRILCNEREIASSTTEVWAFLQPPRRVHFCVGSRGWCSGTAVPMC